VKEGCADADPVADGVELDDEMMEGVVVLDDDEEDEGEGVDEGRFVDIEVDDASDD
jgi:hypothetical protein